MDGNRDMLIEYKQRGISLLEVMLSLVIIAAILLAATKFYESTRRSQLVNAAGSMIQALTTANGSWFYTYQSLAPKGGSPVSLSLLQEAGLVAADISSSTGNPWGGGVEVSPIENQTLCPKIAKNACVVQIQFTLLPDLASCNDLSAVSQQMQTPVTTTDICKQADSGGTYDFTIRYSLTGDSGADASS